MKKKPSQQSAFSLSRLLACLLCLLGFLLAFLGISGSLGTKSLAQGTSNSSAGSVQVGASYHNDVSLPLRDMPAWTRPTSDGEANGTRMKTRKFPIGIVTAMTQSCKTGMSRASAR